MSEAIVKAVSAQPAKAGAWEMTAEQEKMIRDSFLSGASPAEAKMLLEVAKLRRLNPLTRQIHFVKRWDSGKQAEVWAYQVSIDGFRVIADRTGLYDGQDEPEYHHDPKTGTLVWCKVRVYRKGWSRPSVGIAYFSEYVQTKKASNGQQVPNSMWARGPHFMLAKCAEAAAMRKAFPEDCGDLYAPEEMGIEEREVNAPPQGASRTEQVRSAVSVRLAAQTATPAQVVEAQPEPVREEPPPPGDDDAPHDVMTGEVFHDDTRTVVTPEPEQQEEDGPVVTVRIKGVDTDIRTLKPKDLAWWANKLREDVNNPQKGRWLNENMTKLQAIEALMGGAR